MKKKLAIVSLIVLSVFSLFIAGCSKKTEKYTVTFDSDGGTEIASVQVEKGKKVTKPEDPSKEHYVFGGWYFEDTEWVFESDTVTKNTALTAKWTPEVYSVTLKNYDGTVLATENVSYGSLPQYSATPEKPSDAQYTYAFSKWVDEAGNDASLSNIDKNVTLTATFTSTLRSYKIIFKNGAQVLKEETVDYGTLPAAPTETPTKEADAQFTYTFKGWDKTVEKVTGEATYNAEFTPTLRSYKITFKNGDTVLKEDDVNYGVLPTPPADMPTKEADAQYTYTFKGWDKTVENVTGEATYNAEFDSTLRSYKITFKNGEQVLKEETVNYGTLPAAPTETPTKEADAQYTYAFKGWDKEIAEVTGEATYNAEFTPTLRSYKITFKNGEQVLKEETVDYGTIPAAPETNPTKGYDSENHYSFKGWDKTIEKVTGEAVYNAQFNAEKHVYTVDDSDETTDYIFCSCGYKDETYAYDKTVTSKRKELLVDGTGLSLTVEGATFASVEKMTINGVEISGEITSFVIPDAVKSDKERHGLQDVILTVKDELGYSHTLKVPVTLITKEIATLSDLNAALTADDKTDIWYTIYGYYKLTADLGSPDYNGIQNANATSVEGENGKVHNFQNVGGLYGFRGTFDGNKHSISAIIYSNGIFGLIGKGACIKDLTVNAYQYGNGRTTLARSITEATLENVEINVKSGSSDSYYTEGGVITALLSHSSKYIGVKVNATTDLDTLFGFSYWSYDSKKANTFENCEVTAKSIGGIICITGTANMPNPIVSIAGVEGLSVTFLKDAVTADDMTIGQAAEIDTGLSEITSVTLDGEEFTSYEFANGTLTINADAFNAFEAGKKTFKIVGKNADGITVKFDLVITVKLVTTAVTAGNGEIVLSDAAEYDVSLGDYADGAVINAILADENVTYANGKLTLTDAFKNNAQKHGNQTLVVTVEKGGTYYAVSVKILVVTKEITTINELTAALTPIANDAVYGYYRLKTDLSSSGWYTVGYAKDWGASQRSNKNSGFRGTFDGNRKKITSWFHQDGLFGVIGSGAVIKNLTIDVKQYGNNDNLNLTLGYSMMEATLDTVTINVLSGGATSIPTDAAFGLLTCLGAYGNTLKDVNINANGLGIDTLFGTGCWFIYPTDYAANTFENCTITAQSLIGLACTDNAKKTVIPYKDVSGLTANIPA